MDVYNKIKEYRKNNLSPVDIIGCDSYTNTDREKSKQNTLTALLLSSLTRDECVFIAMVNLTILVEKYRTKCMNYTKIIQFETEKIDISNFTVKKLLSFSLKDIIKIKESINFDIEFKILSKISTKEINEAIKIVGFHEKKSFNLKQISIEYRDFLPESLEEISKLKGVGQKMGILYVQTLINKAVGISVDSHVHRICNLLEIVKTKNVKQTQKQLESIFKESEWRNVNKVFVGFGQKTCKKNKPKCNSCPVKKECPFKGKINF